MKVNVNIINTFCILISETITGAKFKDDDFNSFRGIAREAGHTHRHGLVYVNFFTVLRDFENNIGTHTSREASTV